MAELVVGAVWAKRQGLSRATPGAVRHYIGIPTIPKYPRNRGRARGITVAPTSASRIVPSSTTRAAARRPAPCPATAPDPCAALLNLPSGKFLDGVQTRYISSGGENALRAASTVLRAPPRTADEAVGQRRLAMVHVCQDADVSYPLTGRLKLRQQVWGHIVCHGGRFK